MKKISNFVFILAVVALAGWLIYSKNSTKSTATLSQSAQTGTIAMTDETPTTDLSAVGPVQTLNWGLTVQDTLVGSGREAKKGDTVAVHYTGTLANGTKFDSSVGRGQPYVFVLGTGVVIEGWDLGVVGMKVGGKRTLVIPPALAYGEQGMGEAIPPNSTLTFTLELVAIK